jgi:hypothetical protein
VAGLSVLAPGFSGTMGPTAVVVAECAGPVVLADVKAQGSTALTPGVGAVRVTGSAQVLLDGCQVFALSWGSTTGSEPGLSIEGSGAQLNACTVVGGSGNVTFLFGPGSDGAPGILATGSTVRIARTQVDGGDGSSIPISFGNPQSGAPGVVAQGSTIYLRGGPASAITGGTGTELFEQPVYGLGAPAVTLDAASVFTATPDVPLTAGADGDEQVTAPVIELGGGSFTLLAERLATLATAPSVTHPGASVSVGAAGEPGSAFLSFFSVGQGPALAIPGVAGVIVLDLGGYAPLPALLLDGAGLASLPVGVPDVSALAGLTLLVQGLAQSTAGTLSVSSAAFVGIAP